MGTFQSWFRAAPPERTRASVFGVGRRVYVACAGDRLAHVALTDDAGADAQTRLADGTEVEILAWRPRGSHGTRYCVRATRDGLEGWLAVDNLRTHRLRAQPPLRLLRQPRIRRRCERGHLGIPGADSASVRADEDGIGGKWTREEQAFGPVST